MKPIAIATLAACLVTAACAHKVEPPPAAVPQQPISLNLSLSGDALFAFAQAELSDAGRAQLDGFVSQLQAAGAYDMVRVIGHSDRIGSTSANLALSQRRAKAVRDYLVQSGIPADRVSAVGRGSVEPIAACDGQSGQALKDCLAPNRRVDLRVERP